MKAKNIESVRGVFRTLIPLGTLALLVFSTSMVLWSHEAAAVTVRPVSYHGFSGRNICSGMPIGGPMFFYVAYCDAPTAIVQMSHNRNPIFYRRVRPNTQFVFNNRNRSGHHWLNAWCGNDTDSYDFRIDSRRPRYDELELITLPDGSARWTDSSVTIRFVNLRDDNIWRSHWIHYELDDEPRQRATIRTGGYNYYPRDAEFRVPVEEEGRHTLRVRIIDHCSHYGEWERISFSVHN